MTSNHYLSLLEEEARELSDILHLTANENILSDFAAKALNSNFSFRYHLGRIENFNTDNITFSKGNIYRGIGLVNKLEEISSKILNKRLGGVATEFRPLSGVYAMMCTILSATDVGDYILTIDPEKGGHFATQNIIEKTGRKSIKVPLKRETLAIDYDFILEIKDKYTIKMFYIDDSLACQPVDFSLLRQLLGEETILVYDASHPFGLIFAQEFMKPIYEGCDIIQANTHKTFPGPQKGIIHFSNSQLGNLVKDEVGKSLVSSQHTHHTIALHLAIIEMDEFSEDYVKKIIENTRYLYNLLTDKGFSILEPKNKKELITNQLYIRIPNFFDAEKIAKVFYANNISINIRRIFDENFLRIGLQEVTRLGFCTIEMDIISDIISNIIHDQNLESITKSIKRLNLQSRKILYSYDK
ncbi:PLP-dependent aminotransferase family protein [Chryseobacterium potabilaquae]|nr:hypothetical protein [Chryseobacterium potabilaquae]